jgi:hypothetical protein
MNTDSHEMLAGVFGVIALIGGIVSFFYMPMGIGPLALVALIIAILASPKYRGLYSLAAVLVTCGFIVGSAIAVIADNPLY